MTRAMPSPGGAGGRPAARFHPLVVTGIHRTIRDAVVLTLRPDAPDAFRFTPGQYLTFKQDLGGTELRRNYSICAGLDDGELRVGVKRVEGGAFSTFANTELRAGDTLWAMPPAGRFGIETDPGARNSYLGFAGGSGITPVLSILKSVLAREPGSDFTLVYANRAAHTIMFREELEDLKNRHMDRLTLIHVLETGQDIDLFSGRVDREKCALLFKSWINVGDVDAAFICGPEPMMLTISGALEAHGLPGERVRLELFGAGQRGRLPKRAGAARAAAAVETTARITLDGATHQVEMARDASVLEAALANSLDAPFACRAGVCSTCKARVTEGEYEMLANHALEDYEVEAGLVLTCQCYPTGDRLCVDYDLR